MTGPRAGGGARSRLGGAALALSTPAEGGAGEYPTLVGRAFAIRWDTQHSRRASAALRAKLRMSARQIAEFTEAEKRVVETALRERYRETVAAELVEAEMRLDPDRPVLTPCPAIYWSARNAQFVVVKLPGERYRAQFFYSASQLYGTGRTEYESLVDCTLDILRAQADHELQRRGMDADAIGNEFAEEGE